MSFLIPPERRRVDSTGERGEERSEAFNLRPRWKICRWRGKREESYRLLPLPRKKKAVLHPGGKERDIGEGGRGSPPAHNSSYVEEGVVCFCGITSRDLKRKKGGRSLA